MNYIFWFSDNAEIYWHGIIMALAVAAAVTSAAGFRRAQGRSAAPVMLTAVIALPLSYILSRIGYWFFNKEYFENLGDALLSFTSGGHSLLGAAIGLLIAILLAHFISRTESLTAFLDALAPAAALGICIGRLSGYFSFDDRGKVLENEALHCFPYSVFDATNNSWNLSVFVLEAIAAFVIFIAVVILFGFIYKNGEQHLPGGNVFLLFLLLFGVTQGTLESMRLDSLFMNTLGFVRVMQITSLVLIVFVLVVYSVTSIKKRGLRIVHPASWLVCLGLLGLAFYMEFRIHSTVFARNYTVMITCLAVVGYITFRLFALTYWPAPSDSGLWLPLSKKRRGM